MVKVFYQDANIGPNVEVVLMDDSITTEPNYFPAFEKQWNRTKPDKVSCNTV